MALSFPDNPAVGDKHTNKHGQSYEAVQKGSKIVWRAIGGLAGETRFSVGPIAPSSPNAGDLWHDTTQDILKIWDRDDNSEQWSTVGTKPVVSTSAPTNPFDGLMWFNPNDLNLSIYVTYDGSGKWKLLASGSLTDTQTIISQVLPLTWEFDDERFNFELFIDNPDFNFRSIQRRPIEEAIVGDDTIELNNTNGIVSGQSFTLYHPDQGVLDIVRVNSRLSDKRLKLQSILAHNYGASVGGIVGAFLAPTSFNIQPDGTAIVRNNDTFFTKTLNAVENWPNAEFAIRRTAQGTGQFTVRFKYPDETVWKIAPLLRTKSVGAEWRDEIYDIRATGLLHLQISYANSVTNATETVKFMLLYGAPQSSDTLRMERPTNVTPADGAAGVLSTPTLTLSAYRNIFGIPQGGAAFQVALDPNFSQLVVNTSSDDLVAWVGVSGQSANFRGIVDYDERKFIIVGDGGAVRRTTDGGGTFTTLTFANSQNLFDIDFNGDDQFVAVGSNGTIANSQNNGDSWVAASPAAAYTGQFNGVAANGPYVVAVGTGAEIQVSTNGGSIFNKRTAPNSYAGDFKGVDMADANVLAVGTLGMVAFSSNSGASFTKRTPAAAFVGTFNAVAMRPDGRAILVGTNGEVQRTEDYGANFQKIALPDAATTELKGVYIEGDNVVIVGVNGEIYSSDDAGITLVKRPAGSGSTATFNAVAIDADNFALIVGQGGAVQKTLRLEGVYGNSYVVPTGADMLKINTVYWWRGKYIDDVGFESEWSVPTAFSTASQFAYVYQPQNLSPANGAVNVPMQPKLQTTAFNTFGSSDTHAATRWQIASDAGFSNILYNSGDKTVEKTVIDVPGGIGLVDQGTYYWRAQHKGTNLGYSSWSVPTSFKVVNNPAAPNITVPTEAAVGVSLTPTLQSSGFSSTAVGENHSKSQWQISTNAQFTVLTHDSGEVNDLLSYAIPPGVLTKNTVYYARVRHIGLNTGPSPWSSARSFTTAIVAQPSISSPANNATNTSTVPILQSSSFSSSGSETHFRSQWQLSLTTDFATIAYDSGETTNLLQHQVPANNALSGSTVYYARVRHRGSQSGMSDWSASSKFTTGVPSAPSLTAPTAGATNQSIKPVLTSSAYNTTIPGDTHVSSSWQIATDSNFSNIVSQVADSTDAKLSWTSTSVLNPNTQYYARVQHRGSAGGASPWSPAVQFTTSLASTPSITSPGNGAVGQAIAPTLTSSSFQSTTAETHQSSQWQIATDSGFTNLVVNSGEVGNLTSYNSATLGYNTQYYARVRHRGSLTGWTPYSAGVSFTTRAAPGDLSWTSPGTYTFTVPAGVTSINALAIGGGGAGGSGDGGFLGGAGGAGGLRYIYGLSVTPGQSHVVTVGAAQTVPTAYGYGQPTSYTYGGSSSFGGFITAYGGQSGSNAVDSDAWGSSSGLTGAGGGGAGGTGGATGNAAGNNGYTSYGGDGWNLSGGAGSYGNGSSSIGNNGYPSRPSSAGAVRVWWS